MMDKLELLAWAVSDRLQRRRLRKGDERQFSTDDGSIYRRVPAGSFPSFDKVDSVGVQTPPARGGSGVFSQNGWSANDRTLIASYSVPGTTRKFAVRKGDVSVVLIDVAAWIHANIEPIDTGTFDDWGYAERVVRGSQSVVSNHASGTAIDINALQHVMGVRGSWGANAAKIRARLKSYDGVIRWGEDYTGRPDGMHFEVNAGSAAVAKVANKIRHGELGDGTAPTSGVYCRYKDRTDNVLNLQRFMISTFPSYNPYLATGYYGDATTRGVLEFQRRTGVTNADGSAPDGKTVGERTLLKLREHGFKP